jgi:uncharacterized membrane protein YesL
MAILNVYLKTIQHLNERGYIYVWANLLWIALTLPVITAPAAWAGLAHLTHCAHTARQVSLSDFWEGFRANFWRGLVIGLITVVILMINVTNFLAFQPANPLVMTTLRAIWIGTILIWFSIQLYMWVLLDEMANPTLIGALRNAAVMVALNPLFTLGLWPGILIIAILSTVLTPAWLLLTGSMIAVLGTTAVLDRVREAKDSSAL